MQIAKSWQTNSDPDGNGQITVGDTLTYWVRIQNQGTVTLTNVVVSDPLITPNSITCASVAPGLSCSLFGNYTVTLQDESAGSIDNTGSATANEIPSPLTINVSTPVVPRPTSMSAQKFLVSNTDPDGNGKVTVGDVLTYEVHMVNIGTQPISGVQVSDPLITPSSVSCPLVNAGGNCILAGVYTVTAADASAGSINNTGSVTSVEIPGPLNPTLSVAVFPATTASMTVTKSMTFNADADNNGRVTVGDVLTFTVQIINTGSVVLNNPTFSDPITTPSTGGPGAPIPVGGGASFSGLYTVTVADEAAGSISNTGSASTTEIPGPTFSNTLVTPVVTRTTSMSVQKTLVGNTDPDGNGQVTAGDVLTYQVQMLNTGTQPITNVQVTDPLTTPSALTCPTVNAGGTCVLSGSYTVTAADSSAGVINNTGSATSSQIPGPVSSSLSTPVVTPTMPSMTVTKTLSGFTDPDGNGQVTVGDVLTYNVAAANNGTQTLTNVVVSDALTVPSSVTCATLSIGASCTLIGNYTVTTADATAGSIGNTGSAVATQIPAAVTSVLTTTVHVPIPAAPSILATTSGDGQSLVVGVASQALTVQLASGTSLLAGKAITWTTTGGTLAAASTITDINGQTSTTVTIQTPGSVVVTATFAGTATILGSSVSFTLNGAIAEIPTLTPSEVSVAIALDASCAELASLPNRTPAQQDLLNQCLALTASNSVVAVANALEEMLPDVAQVQTQSSQVAASAQFNNINGRMLALRSGSYGSSLAGLSLVGPGASVSLASLGAALLDETTPAKSEQTFERWGLFASGSIGRGESDPGRQTPAYDFDINGLTVGVDYRKTDGWVLGGALGFTRQDSTLAGQQGSLDTSGWSVSGYSTWYEGDSWYVDSLLSYGRNSYDHRRRIVYSLPLPDGSTFDVDQIAKGTSNGTDLSASATFGRDFHKAAWTTGVYARGLYSRLGFEGFRERLDSTVPGGGLALDVADRNVTALSSVIGGKVSYAHSATWGVLVPHVDLEWQREYRSDPETFRALFVNDPTGTPILVTGDALDNSYWRVGVGLSMVLTRGRSGFLYYVRTVGRDGITQDNLTLGFRMEF